MINRNFTEGSRRCPAIKHSFPIWKRLWKEVDGVRTHFLYSDEGLIGEYDAVGNEIKTYGWQPDTAWGTDPLFLKQGITYYWYHNNHLGAPQKLTMANGLVVWEARYDSFGSAQVTESGITNNLRLPGMYYDAETGLCYNYNRYYDPSTGRYLTTDPLGFGLNLYAYCYNNPHGFVDPLGLCPAPKLRKFLHTGFAFAGMLPGLGVIPDLLDAGLYLLEGDLTNAGIAGLAAIPLAGQIVRGGKYGAKYWDEGVDIGRKVDDVVIDRICKVPASKRTNFNQYETLSEQAISGTSRSSHRASANKNLMNQMKQSPDVANAMNKELGTDVIKHMKSGKGQLKNPPGTEWHHPVDNPDVMHLLKKGEHRNSQLKDVLHPDNIGGFGTHYGN
ncbi:MAG: RHS repeat-associated core domain-containing protein [Thermodesulfobacteriota bacterium]|nr:RHS repeat-associated core domain-containing protein [Thermodesulfobacteriota bacterium]